MVDRRVRRTMSDGDEAERRRRRTSRSHRTNILFEGSLTIIIEFLIPQSRTMHTAWTDLGLIVTHYNICKHFLDRLLRRQFAGGRDRGRPLSAEFWMNKLEYSPDWSTTFLLAFGFAPRIDIHTGQLLAPTHWVYVLVSAAVVELSVVGVQVWMSFRQINDFLRIWCKTSWAENTALRDATVNWNTVKTRRHLQSSMPRRRLLSPPSEWRWIAVLLCKMDLLTLRPWPLTFYPKTEPLLLVFQSHSIYQVRTFSDHSLLSYANRQTGKQTKTNRRPRTSYLRRST